MARCLSCGRRVAGVHHPCGRASPSAPRAPLAAPAVAGYRVLEPLGSGGFAIVVAAERQGDGARVALKVAHPRAPVAAAQVRREAAALRSIGAPAVPALLAEGQLADGTPWLAMELVAGASLASRLEARGGALAPGEVSTAALAVVDAVAAVHGAGWAHGDLKPENVILDADGRARLLDLGLAERLASAAAPAPGAAAGTVEYMAPERHEGAPADVASDVYAMGALLFEMIAGRPPFFGGAGEVRHGHLVQRPPRLDALAAIDEAVDGVVRRCLAKPPADRYASMQALRAALAPALAAAAPRGAMPAGTKTAAPTRLAQRKVGVAFVEASSDGIALRHAATSLGGVVAHAERGRCALVFDAAAGENPVRTALRAGWRVVDRGIGRRVRIDLLTATIQPRREGGDRYLSAAFAQRDSWPAPDDPEGVVVTARAADVLPGDPLVAVPGRSDLFADRDAPGERSTSVRPAASPLLGYEALVRDLLAEVATATAGRRPTVLSVVGDAGVGKTHLAAAVADRVRLAQRGVQVIELRARPVADAGEGDVLRALLRTLLHLPRSGGAPPDGGRALIQLAAPDERDGEVWAGAALALGWVDPSSPAVRGRAAAPGALSGLRSRAAAALLRNRAAARPVVVIVDDAHLADGAALDALELATLAEAGAPICVCAVARPAFAESRPGWGDRAAHARALRLPPLDGGHAAELCRRLLLPAEDVPARAVEWLVSRSQGVPLLLVELVRGLKRDGVVRARAADGAHYVATDELDRIPEMPVVEWLAARELAALPAALAAHAQLAAILGGAELTAGELSGVLARLERAGHGDSFPLDAGSATDRLVARGLLVAQRGGVLQFRLPLVRDALASAFPVELARAVHQAAFEFYSAKGAIPERLRLRRLAVHAAAAGHAAQAGAIELSLARELAGSSNGLDSSMVAGHGDSYVDAEARYSRALEHLPPSASAERLEALRGRGLMRSFVGRAEEAVHDLVAARALAHRLGWRDAEVACVLDEATVLDLTSDFARSRARAEEALTLASPVPGALAARLELARGRSLFRSSRWDDAVQALARCVAIAERADDDAYETLVVALLLLGTALPVLGRVGEAEAALDRARALAERRGDLVHLAAVHINWRNLRIAREDPVGAIHDQLESVRIARELGMVSAEYMGEYNLAELHYQLDDAPGAAPHLARAAHIERRHREVMPIPLSSLLSARVALLAEDVAAARRLHADFARCVEAAAGGLGRAEAVLADMVELATRDATEAEWDALVERSRRDSVEQEPIEVLEVRGLAELRAGHGERARASLRAALDLARRIPNLLAPRVRRALECAGG